MLERNLYFALASQIRSGIGPWQADDLKTLSIVNNVTKHQSLAYVVVYGQTDRRLCLLLLQL